jgi:hypothetical protein
MVWQNSAGLLGVQSLTLAKEYAAVSHDSKTACWNYIVHPSFKNASYIMNANSTLFLMTEEEYDKDDVHKLYELVQSPYAVGLKSCMLFYMNYADDKKEKLLLKEVFTRYVIDVDEATSNLILVPDSVASPLSAWQKFATVKEAEDSRPPVEAELTEKQEEFVDLVNSMEIPAIESYLKNVTFVDFANADNIGGEKYTSLLAREVNDFPIEDKVELITAMVRSAVGNKEDMAKLTILGALAEINFSETNEDVEPLKDAAQQSIREITKEITTGISKTYVSKIIKNLE